MHCCRFVAPVKWGLVIDGDRLPIHPGLLAAQSLTPDQLLDWVLYGGEDFELVLTLERDVAESLKFDLFNGVEIIGDITVEPEILLMQAGIPMSLSQTKGFQHW